MPEKNEQNQIHLYIKRSHLTIAAHPDGYTEDRNGLHIFFRIVFWGSVCTWNPDVRDVYCQGLTGSDGEDLAMTYRWKLWQFSYMFQRVQPIKDDEHEQFSFFLMVS